MQKLLSIALLFLLALPALGQTGPVQAYAAWEPLNYKGKLTIVADWNPANSGSVTIITNWVNEIQDRTANAETLENLALQSSTFQSWANLAINGFGANDSGGLNAGSFANTARTTDPWGGNTADFVQENTVNSFHLVRIQSATLPAGNLTFSAYIKGAGRDYIQFQVDDGPNGAIGVFTLTNLVAASGSFGTTTVGPARISDAGNSWCLCELDFQLWKPYTGVPAQQYGIYFATNNTGTSSYVGNGTSGYFIVGAQIRNAALARLGAPYQVTTTTRIGGSHTLYSGYGASSNYTALTNITLHSYLHFDGAWAYLKSPQFPLTQPETLIMSLRPLSSTASDTVFDGNSSATGRFYQGGSGNPWSINAGTDLADSTTNSMGVLTAASVVFNGASSWFSIYNRTNATGNAGAANMNGFTLSSIGNGGANIANVQVGRILVTTGRTNTVDELNYLRWGSRKLAGYQ